MRQSGESAVLMCQHPGPRSFSPPAPPVWPMSYRNLVRVKGAFIVPLPDAVLPTDRIPKLFERLHLGKPRQFLRCDRSVVPCWNDGVLHLFGAGVLSVD